MAITSVGNLGTASSGVSGRSLVLTLVAQLDFGNTGMLVIACDNTAAADGDNAEVVSVADSAGNVYQKLGEFTNANAAAAGGVTTSLWMVRAIETLAIGATVTIVFGAAKVDKAASFWEFTTTAGKILSGASRAVNGTDASAGFGALTLTGLRSAEYLFFRGLGKEANSTTALTPTANYSMITAARSRNNAAAIAVRGEFRIVTATQETSDPIMAVTGDTASVMSALVEVDAPRAIVNLVPRIAGVKTTAGNRALAGIVQTSGVEDRVIFEFDPLVDDWTGAQVMTLIVERSDDGGLNWVHDTTATYQTGSPVTKASGIRHRLEIPLYRLQIEQDGTLTRINPICRYRVTLVTPVDMEIGLRAAVT